MSKKRKPVAGNEDDTDDEETAMIAKHGASDIHTSIYTCQSATLFFVVVIFLISLGCLIVGSIWMYYRAFSLVDFGNWLRDNDNPFCLAQQQKMDVLSQELQTVRIQVQAIYEWVAKQPAQP